MPDEPSKRPALSGDFRVGEWLVQPSLDRLSRGDTLVHLRPQLTDLLLVLARHAGKTVSKEAILKEVWATEYVGESVLTRCITEIRQALHDNARAPTVLETIPKRGYRLVAPVEFLADEQPGNGNGNGDGHARTQTAGAAVAAVACPVPSPGSAAAPELGLPVEERTAVADGGPSREPLSRTRGLLHRLPWTALKAAVVVGVAVTVGAGDWRAPAVISSRDTVLLADVANSTGIPVFDHALRLALAVNLEQAPFLRVLPQPTVREALVRMGRSPEEPVVGPLALDVCKRERAAVLLAASIAPLGSRYVVGLEAVACGTGESMGRAIGEARGREDVLTVLEQVATRIRVKLGESRSSLRQYSMPLVRATTASLPALEALTFGDESRDHGRLSNALGFYRQATELDPGFAVAWARRGAAAHTMELPEEAQSSIRRAYELRDKVSQPERFYIEAHYYREVAADPQKAIETYQEWKRVYPGSLVPTTNLASILAGSMGQYDAALVEAREAVRLAPYSSIARGALIASCLGSGRIAEARQVIADATRRGISDRVVHYYSLTLALFDKDAAALDREIRWASGEAVTALGVSASRAAAAMAEGRVREARTLWSEALVRAGEIDARRVAEVHLGWAESEALVGDPRRAREAVKAALAADRSAPIQIGAAAMFAFLGDDARARAALDSAAGQASLGPVDKLVGVPVARALLESARGQGDRAIAVLQPVVPFEGGSQTGPAPLAVRALVELARHRPSEAVAPLERVIRMRVLYPASPWVPFARLTLARALRESGDSGRGAAAYDEFLASWKDADRDVALLKAAQDERAAVRPSAQ